MKSNKKVIDALNKLLTGELTSMDLYFLHSRLYQDWGYTKLFERIDHEKDDEQDHAAKLMERIIFLGGMPNVQDRNGFEIKTDVKEMLEQSLDDEMDVAKNLKEVIKLCEEERDYVSRDLLCLLLKDTEEDHIDWLETQLGLIEKLGIQNYLQSVSKDSETK